MSLSARVRSKKKSPEKVPRYVLNVSIDVPLKTKYAITSQLQEQFMPSPNRLKKKYQISVTPVRNKGRSESASFSNSRVAHKKNISSGNSYRPKGNNNKSQKVKSLQQTLKHTPRLSQKTSKVVRNISVLEHLEKEDSVNTIKYTTKTQEEKQ